MKGAAPKCNILATISKKFLGSINQKQINVRHLKIRNLVLLANCWQIVDVNCSDDLFTVPKYLFLRLTEAATKHKTKIICNFAIFTRTWKDWIKEEENKEQATDNNQVAENNQVA